MNKLNVVKSQDKSHEIIIKSKIFYNMQESESALLAKHVCNNKEYVSFYQCT